MKLSKRKINIIELMEQHNYTWLTHLSKNAVMRFRNARRRGFTNYAEVEGLIFLTKRVAEALTSGTRNPNQPRLTVGKQVEKLQAELAKLEQELYKARGDDPESIIKYHLPKQQDAT